MQLSDLAGHLRRGGAATLNHPARYPVPEGAIIAPARYRNERTRATEFVFEPRYIENEFRPTVLVDSKSSQANRSEEGVLTARRAGGAAAAVPVIAVRYAHRTLLDLEMPHRAFDAHVRLSSYEGRPVVDCAWYRDLRDATEADLTPVFTTSPSSIAWGGWDSLRRSGQLRLRSLFVSELFGVIPDNPGAGLSRRSGARLDPLGQQIYLTPAEYEALLSRQREHMSDRTVREVEGQIAKARKKQRKDRDEVLITASTLGLGGIPPGTEEPFGVAVSEVRRVRTYSLAKLRRLRFGGSEDEDVAARTALLALLLLGAAYADADPELRAYCDVGAPRATVLLDDEQVDLDLSIEACTEFLAHAIERLPRRLAWTGQVIELEGHEALASGARDGGDDEE